MMLDAGIANVKVHAVLGGASLRPPEADARTNTMLAATMTEVAMTMALRFILNRHRSLFVLYGLSRPVPVRKHLQGTVKRHAADAIHGREEAF
jgi:hypothetical protein